MGLDSVELIMDIENYFGIQIPDREAEKIYTIQNMVDAVAGHLHIKANNFELRDDIFKRIADCIPQTILSGNPVQLTDHIANYFSPFEKETWRSFKKKLNLTVPEPDVAEKSNNKFSIKFKKFITWTPSYEWNIITIDTFINAIAAANYETLLDRSNIKSTYEIYIAVMAITVNKTGVDYYEISPEKSFTSDLGVD